jgi:putative Holliday junction resolvase
MNFALRDMADLRLDDFSGRRQVLAGLDIGDKTVGLAVSDRTNRVASPVTTLIRKIDEDVYRTLRKHLHSLDVGLVVFGWPLQMNGIAGSQCEKVLDFVRGLAAHIDVSFAPWDERFSTCAVERIMLEADLSRKKRRQLLDKVEAVYILQGAIDFLNGSGPRLHQTVTRPISEDLQ